MKYVIEMGENMAKEPNLATFSKFAETLKEAHGVIFIAWTETRGLVFAHGTANLDDIIKWLSEVWNK